MAARSEMLGYGCCKISAQTFAGLAMVTDALGGFGLLELSHQAHYRRDGGHDVEHLIEGRGQR